MPLGFIPLTLINIEDFNAIEIKANAKLAMITIRDKRNFLTVIQVRQNLKKLCEKMKSQIQKSEKRISLG